jgi:hypothetical protein
MEVVTVAWNAIEGILAVTAGVLASSVALVGFGVDSSSALAVFRLMTSRKRSACSTGRSAGLAPLRMLAANAW